MKHVTLRYTFFNWVILYMATNSLKIKAWQLI